jgi:hypothetical protein
MNRRHCARWFAYSLRSDLAEARLSRHSRYRNSNLLGAMAFGTKRQVNSRERSGRMFSAGWQHSSRSSFECFQELILKGYVE